MAETPNSSPVRCGITIHSSPGIPASSRGEVRKAVAWLRKTQRIPHHVRLYSFPEQALWTDQVGACQALFEWPSGSRAEGEEAKIGLAAGYADALTRHGCPPGEALEQLLLCLFHEWAHYEQWRDGRAEGTERGVEVRARNLFRQFQQAEAPHDQ